MKTDTAMLTTGVRGSAPWKMEDGKWKRLAHWRAFLVLGALFLVLMGPTAFGQKWSEMQVATAMASGDRIGFLDIDDPATPTGLVKTITLGNLSLVVTPTWGNVAGKPITISTSSGATLTLAANSTFATVGAYALTLTATAATSVTLPTTGTLATRAGTETLTNKTIDGSSNTLTNVSLSTATTGTLLVTRGGTGLTERAAFRVQLGGAQSFSTGAPAVVEWDSVIFDIGSYFVMGLGAAQWTPGGGQTVTVHLVATVAVADVSGAQVRLHLRKNGTTIAGVQRVLDVSGTPLSLTVSVLDRANGTSDYYDVAVEVSSGGSSPMVAVGDFPGENYFAGTVIP